MPRYINCEDFCKEVDEGDLLVGNNADWAKELAYRTQESDVEPVVHARWRCYDSRKGIGLCSHCNRLDKVDPLASHCRYCGAKMDL